MTTNTKTVAFVNLKGGVGKTTSAIGTAEALARLGHTVTVRDADLFCFNVCSTGSAVFFRSVG